MFPNAFSYICSRQGYSMYIALFRLAHLQQSPNLPYRHRSIPTCANAAVVKASHPLAFPYIRTHLITCYVFRLFFVYMLSSKLQYKHCSIPTCASAAVVQATVQTLFNLISLSFTLSFSLSPSRYLSLFLSFSFSPSPTLSLSHERGLLLGSIQIGSQWAFSLGFELIRLAIYTYSTTSANSIL